MHLLIRAQIAHLKADKAFTEVPNKYVNFVDIFLPKLAIKRPKHIRMNNYIIELVDDWQLSYGFIYSLRPVELKTLKVYIENNLTNNFIKLFKFPAKVLIFFNKKLDDSLKLYVDY